MLEEFWNTPAEGFVNSSVEDLRNCQKVSVHKLEYMLDCSACFVLGGVEASLQAGADIQV